MINNCYDQVVWIKERRFHHIAKHWWNAAFKGEPSINVEYIMVIVVVVDDDDDHSASTNGGAHHNLH